MIFHNKYTITIGRFSEMLDSENSNLVKRINIPLPKKFIKIAEYNLIEEFNEILSNKKAQNYLEDFIHSGSMRIRIYKLYPSMLKSMQIYLQWKFNPDENIKMLFMEHFGFIPKNLEDLDPIIKKINFLELKYKELYPENKPVENNKKFEFETMLIGIEMTLNNTPISRNLKLFQLKSYIDTATTILSKKEHGRN